MKQAKILFFPNVAKKSIKNNLIPIYLRVSKNVVKAEANLNVAIEEKELKNWDEFSQLHNSKNSVINSKILEVNEEFKGLKYRYNEEDYKHFTPQEIRDKITKKEIVINEPDLLVDYINKHYESLLEIKNLGDGTIRNYKKSITHFKNYIDYTKQQKVKIKDFSPQMAFEFYQYLQKEIPLVGKKKMTDVSASCVLIKIKAIFERATDHDIISKNPFKRVKLQTKSPKKEPLTIEEVKSLSNLEPV